MDPAPGAVVDWAARWQVPQWVPRHIAWHEATHATAAILIGAEVGEVLLDRDGGRVMARGGEPFAVATVCLAPWRPSRQDIADAVALIGRDRLDEARQAGVTLLDGHRDAIGRVAAELLATGRV